jgi:transporter, SSS family
MQSATLHLLDYLIIGLSLIVPVSIGLKYSKKQNNTKKYFTASGTIPAWAIGISILATLISSVTFLAYPGEGYTSNWILLVQGLMIPITLAFFIGFVVPLYRNVIKLSAYEYFEKRFGFGARLYSSLGFFLAHFSKMSTVFYLVALAFSKMTGFNSIDMIWIIGFIVVFITLIGGMEAVIWMDVVQGLLLICGGVTALLMILFTTPGGISAIWNVALENGHVGFGPFDFSFVKLTFWVMTLNGIFYAIQKYGTDQTIVQRYLTAKSDKGAIKASLIGVMMSVPVWALFMFIGTTLYSYYHIQSGILAANIKAEEVFPYFIMTQLPVGVVGLVLAALLAAAIASLNSDLNCLSAILVGDYFIRFKPNSTEKQRMFMSRLLIALAGVASIIMAMYYVYHGGDGILGTLFILYSIFSGGIAGLFLLGIFTSRTNKQGVYIGILTCVIFTAYAVLTSSKIGSGAEKHLILNLGQYNFTHHKMMIGVYSHVILFSVGYVASLFFKNKKDISDLTYRSWKDKKNSASAQISFNSLSVETSRTQYQNIETIN